LDEAFIGKNVVCNPEGKIVHIRGEIEMISTGYSNLTPWHSPRELDENALYEKILSMASGLINPRCSIFNLHCPPYDYGLDIAARLDKSLKPIAGIGGVEMGPVGSQAVLKSIQVYQPMLGLHGHVHESRGAVKVGRTLCVNPGSEYTEGILRGCLVLINKKGVRDYLLTSG
jgi:Icc-related predicted phosphoesterase